ncbi:MAG TPA: hypothetical protein VLZ83_08815 [Edaphocola sp.]|nr:hypothetical protein [Edaphocola sp.]
MRKQIIKRVTGNQLTSTLDEGEFLIDVHIPKELLFGNAEQAANILLNPIENKIKQLKKKDKVLELCKSENRIIYSKLFLVKNSLEDDMSNDIWKNVNKIINNAPL